MGVLGPCARDAYMGFEAQQGLLPGKLLKKGVKKGVILGQTPILGQFVAIWGTNRPI